MLKKLLPFALVFLIFSGGNVPAPAQAAPQMACRHRSSLGGGVKIGSQVDGDLVTICLSKAALQKLREQAAAKPSSKPSAKPKPRVKVTARPKAKPVVRTKTRSRGRAGNGVFKPRINQPGASPRVLKPGQSTRFKTTQPVRAGYAILAGSRVQVRFTPILQNLSFGDSAHTESRARNFSISHVYQSRGQFLILLRVTYRVDYRLIGAQRWLRDPDSVTLAAQPLVIDVGAAPKRLVLLRPTIGG